MAVLGAAHEVGEGFNESDETDEKPIQGCQEILIAPLNGPYIPPMPKRERPDTDERVNAAMTDYFNQSAATEEDDEDYMFFRSMAKTCHKLSPRAKSVVKMKIHQIMHEAELESMTDDTEH